MLFLGWKWRFSKKGWWWLVLRRRRKRPSGDVRLPCTQHWRITFILPLRVREKDARNARSASYVTPGQGYYLRLLPHTECYWQPPREQVVNATISRLEKHLQSRLIRILTESTSGGARGDFYLLQKRGLDPRETDIRTGRKREIARIDNYFASVLFRPWFIVAKNKWLINKDKRIS